MDYELLSSGNVKIGQLAPDFEAKSTEGNINLQDYRGRWLVLFSYPEDFDSVSTTEVLSLSEHYNEFKKLNTFLIGISIDSIASHLEWVTNIYYNTGFKVPIPIIEDRLGEISRKYGMISKEVSNFKPLRNVYIIDENGIVREILNYPMEIGRNVFEILRIVNALQLADKEELNIPSNWLPGLPLLERNPSTYNELENRLKNPNGITWYTSFKM